ncbi:MAG: histidine kinase [Moraxellaceae bacterium]|nr:histidine kinase [Moraxellaceae bacterium]
MIWDGGEDLLALSLSRDDGADVLLLGTLAVACETDGRPCVGLLLHDAADTVKAGAQVEAMLQRLGDCEVGGRRLAGRLEAVNSRTLQTEKLAAIGQLAAGVAHEINNPMGYVFSNLKALGGYVQDLIRIVDAIDTAGGMQELREFKESLDYDYIRNDVGALIGESEEGIDRVKRIISALKDFSRVDDDALQPADLHRGIDSTLNVVNNELKYKAEVVKEYGALPEVECIPSQINQVLMNLLVNASHAIEGFGRITVRSAQEGDWVWLEVEDTGAGIDPKDMSRLFEPFFTTKPVGKGTGLGLSLSYSIIQKHHGRIEVFSQLGCGSRFRFWLPLRQPTSPDRSEAAT